MKKLSLFTAAIVAVVLLSFKIIAPSTWTLDKGHGKLGFVITHLMVNDVEGAFTNFDATITAINDDFTDASVTMTADVSSVTTLNPQRDGHLKSEDFFDAAKYPTITFASTSFKKTGANTYKVIGSLTLHGVTKPVELNATFRTGTNPMSHKTIAGCKISGILKRSDFGIGSKFPSAMVGDEITLNANAEFVKQ